MLLPKGNTRLLFSTSQSGTPAQPNPGVPPEQDFSLLSPLSEGDTRLNPTSTTPVMQSTTPTKGKSSPPTSAPPARPCRGTSLGSLSRRDVLYMITTAKRVRAARTRSNARHHQTVIAAQFPDLRPASLPVHNRLPAPTPLLPRSLSSLGWHRDPSYRIEFDPPQEASFPFPHSPPDSPTQSCQDPYSLGQDNCLSAPPTSSYDGTPLPADADDFPTSPRSVQDILANHTPAPSLPRERLKFLTIIAKKAGANSPSLTDIVTQMDQHSPDFLLLTETPMHPQSGALLHVLRNWEYRVHHHQAKAPFHPDGLPEARLPAQITHPGGGCWLAYKKHASWTPLVSPLTLTQNCPRATT
jgi:hypothetical protein